MPKKLKLITKKLKKAKLTNIKAEAYRKSVRLSGEVETWEDKIKAGYIAAKKGFKGVVNDIKVNGIEEEHIPTPEFEDNEHNDKCFDVVIIGGGVIGCSIARELSRFNISIALLEKEEDIAKHASGRNDGMIHPGFAASPGSKKAYYNIRGNRLYTQLCQELNIDFKRPGSLILYTTSFTKLLNPILKSRAKKNNVDGYEYLNRKKISKMEPYISKEQHGGFFLPSAGILSPYKLTIALAENAIQNRAEFCLNTMVTGFEIEKAPDERITTVITNRGKINASVVVNASGIWADKIAELADDRFFSIHPRKGMDAILDTKCYKYQKRIAALVKLTQMKSKTKGGGVVPCIEGNLLVGPTAEEVPYREDYSTDSKNMNLLIDKLNVNTKLSKSDIITYFAGTRACTYEEDFIIERSEKVSNLVHAAGIQSPGLASAPAIAEDISKMCIDILKKEKEIMPNLNFNPERVSDTNLNHIALAKRSELIRKNHSYGRIVCRCEAISEGEIKDALNSPIPAETIDGIKRRTRAGTGRCHGGFCTPRIMEIIAENKKGSMLDIKKKGQGSELFLDETKGNIDYSNKKVKTDKL